MGFGRTDGGIQSVLASWGRGCHSVSFQPRSYQRLTGALRRSLGNVTALHSLKNVVLGDLLSYTYNSRSASSYWRAFSPQLSG